MTYKNRAPVKAPVRTPGVTNESGKTQEGSSKRSIRNVSKMAVLITGIVVFGSIALFTSIIVMANTRSIKASNAEYNYLREVADELDAEGSGGYNGTKLSALDEEMLQINQDYVCWIRISGTNIDYPVVRGYDNKTYINTSFYGEENITGAIFMDYRVVGDYVTYTYGESLPHIIIYGHNLQQGTMFSQLHKLRNEQFLAENNVITLIVHDQTVNFEIFSVRLSSIEDPAYFLDFDASNSFPRFANRIDAPLKAAQIITLSTCAKGGNDSARLIVQGYRAFD